MKREMPKGEQFKAFLGELKPGITTPFAEFRQLSQEEREVLNQKLEELKKQEEYALATYRSIEASGLQEYIRKLEARLNEHKKSRYSFLFSELVRGASVFSSLPVLKGTYGYLKSVTFDYYAKQRQESPEFNIGTGLDEKVPLKEERLPDYLSFVPFWISGMMFVRKEFGQQAINDSVKILTDMAGFYAEAGAVFEKAQTTFHRGGEGGGALKFLRVIDKEKNMFPSLHAEVVGHTYGRLNDIIDNYADDKNDYALVKQRIFKRAVKILESCLLLKQHSYRDIPAGLAAISVRDPRFTNEQARALIQGMFVEDNAGMNSVMINELQTEMLLVYEKLMNQVKTDPDKDYSQILIEYVESLEEKGAEVEAAA